MQFAVLPVCFLAAVVLVGLRERRLRAALREQLLVLVLLLVPALGLFAVGPGRALGFYEGVLDIDVLSLEFTKWVGLDAMLLAYASGVVLAPGAAARPLACASAAALPRGARLRRARGHARRRPPARSSRIRARRRRIQERYFFYAVPLVGILFVLYASRGWPHRLAHGVLAAGIVLARGARPAVGLFGRGLQDRLADAVRHLAAGAGARQRLARLPRCSRWPSRCSPLPSCSWHGARRSATPATLGSRCSVSAATYGAAVSFNLGNADRTRTSVLGPQPSFVDCVR